jgi:hypothetical protein
MSHRRRPIIPHLDASKSFYESPRHDSALRSTHSGSPTHRPGHVRHEGYRDHFPPIKPLQPPKGSERPDRLDRRCWLWPSSAFGGPCSTPTAERLASEGLKYGRFHTMTLCSPTRQALLRAESSCRIRHGAAVRISRDRRSKIRLAGYSNGRHSSFARAARR